ncbi:MAG: FecR domain-containing protein [Candidatus Neomarinimicrobiota bacterium]
MKHSTIRLLFSYFLVRFIILAAALAVALPLWAQESPIALVLKSRGEMLMRRQADATFATALQPADSLFNGDAVRAGEDGFASLICLDDKTLLKVKANSQFQFVESENVRTIDMQYGTLRSTLPQPVKSFRIETPVSVASVKATDFWLIHDLRAGVDRAYGVEGVVEILNQISGITQNLTAYTMIISTAAGVVTPPVPITTDELPIDPDEVELEPEPEVPEEGVEEEAPEVEVEVEPGEAVAPLEELFIGEEPAVEEPVAPAVEEAPEEEAAAEKAGPGFGLGLGSVTIGGQVYYQLALRPEFRFGKIGIGLDLVGYMDAQGNFRKDEWDEPSDYLDKVLYLRYGTEQDPFFFQIGAMPQVQYGFGALMNNYSNMAEFPQVRRVGFEVGGRVSKNIRVKGFTADLKEFRTRGGLVGLRGTYRLSEIFPLTLGMSVLGDLNQYGGLKDKDGDGRPDLVDDFPQDKEYWLDSDGDGRADNDDETEFDIDGDGFTDNTPDPINQPNNDLDGIDRAPEPFNLEEEERAIMGVSADISYPILNRKALGLVAYAEYGLLNYGGPLSVLQGDKLYKSNSGSGIVGPGLRARVLNLINLGLEYRYTSALFQPGFFNSTYDFERARIIAVSDDSSYVETKDQASISNPYNLSGIYGSASASLFNVVTFSAAYQNLKPAKADTLAKESNSFIANLSVNTDMIPKISDAMAYYIRTNDENPFDFANPSSNTTWGYRVAYALAPGVDLIYNQQVSYRYIAGEIEEVRLLTVETAFRF